MARKKVDAGILKLTIDNPIGPALKKLPKEVQAAIEKVVKKTGDKLEQRIKDDTPRDRGQAGGLVSKWKRSGTADEVVLTNTAPYANVIEFGGYPVRPARGSSAGGAGFKRGKAILGGLPPGPRTQTAPGGSPAMVSNVSRQAPSGMVRQNLERITAPFVFDLEEAIDEAFSEIAQAQP